MIIAKRPIYKYVEIFVKSNFVVFPNALNIKNIKVVIKKQYISDDTSYNINILDKLTPDTNEYIIKNI